MRGLYMAEGAMLAQQMRLETTGNNLSNQHTPGYKKDETVQTSFAEWLVSRTGSGDDSFPAGRRQAVPTGVMAHNVAIEEDYTHFTQGQLEETGRTLDLALEGEGFFEVEIDDESRYTRNGRFFLNEESVLVDVEGNPVQGEDGPVVLDVEEMERGSYSIEEDGSIYLEGEFVDQLQVVDFPEEADLAKEGDNLYVPEEGAEDDFVDSEARVMQGFVENSNVDLSEEIVNLMEARNSFETAQRVMITYDSILEKAANELGAMR